MSVVALNVRDELRAIHGIIHGADVDRIVAALSAQPESIAELAAALPRFIRGGQHFFRSFHSGTSDEPWDAGIAYIDLAARLVVCRSSYSRPGPCGWVAYHDGTAATHVRLEYHLPDDWSFSDNVEAWETQPDSRRAGRGDRPRRDARRTLYGRLAELIAGECLAAARSFGRRADFDQSRPACGYGAARQAGQLEWLAGEQSDPLLDDGAERIVAEIHGWWLGTPRDELGGLAPRDVLLARHAFIQQDLQDRAQHWRQLGWCPPGLDPRSAAFRFAGFGTHEIVLYYELMRHLLWACWDRAFEQPHLDPRAEADWLRQLQQEWLDTPQDDELCGRSPAQVIDAERMRLPLPVARDQERTDADCPLCHQASAEAGPRFLHLCGCQLNDDFVFSFYRTAQQWEEEQGGVEPMPRRTGPPLACVEEVIRFQDSQEPLEAPPPRSIGKGARSAPVGVLALAIGASLSELRRDLQRRPGGQASVERLNCPFAQLRDALAEPSRALLVPIIERFVEALDGVAATWPELAEKAADLQGQLRDLVAECGSGACEGK